MRSVHVKDDPDLRGPPRQMYPGLPLNPGESFKAKSMHPRGCDQRVQQVANND